MPITLSNGPDTIIADDRNNRISALGGDDVVEAKGGNDEVYGDNGNDKLYGGPGDDRLYGGNGNDEVHGDDGNDLVQGGAGNDRLRGGKGDDTLIGGTGNDTLAGEFFTSTLDHGKDTFKFLSPAQTDGDYIIDFETGWDRIDVSAIDANTTAAGNQAFDVVSGAFTRSGQINYYKDPHDPGAPLVVGFNTDSDPQAEFSITMRGMSYVTDGDFVL